MPRRITTASPMLDYMVTISVPFARGAYLDPSMPVITKDEIGPNWSPRSQRYFSTAPSQRSRSLEPPVMTIDPYGHLFPRDDDVHGFELAASIRPGMQ